MLHLNMVLTPIVCCGETLEEREAGRNKRCCSRQVTKALAGLTEEQVKQTSYCL